MYYTRTQFERLPLVMKMSCPRCGCECGFPTMRKRKLDVRQLPVTGNWKRLKTASTDSAFEEINEPLDLQRNFNHYIEPDVPDIAFVQTAAHDYPVYDYTQRRVQTAIGEFVSPLTSSILIASDNEETLRDILSEKLTGDVLRTSTGNSLLDRSVVYIGGDDDCFAFLRKTTRAKNSILCRITPQLQSSSENVEYIRTEDWGFQCFPKDFSNIFTNIDHVLEHYAFDELNRAASALRASGELKDENIAKMQNLYKKTSIPMPEWLIKWKQKENKWKEISNTVLSYTSVFGCDTSKEKLGILMLKENESKQLDVIQHLKSLGLSEDKFYIQVIEIQPLAGGKFESGDKIQVRGSNKSGTLAGFALFQKNKTGEREMMAITAKHVVETLNQGRKELHIDNENLGEVIETESTSNGPSYDIAIAKVTAPKQKCNSKFRFENGKDGFADLFEPEHEHQESFKDERVHFWGAETSPGVAEISSLQLKSSDAGKYICIETHRTAKAFAKQGDSGAMVLMERSPRESDHMFAIGSLVGEVRAVPVGKQESEITKMRTQTQPENITATTSDQGNTGRAALDSTSNETTTQTKRYIVVPLEKAFQQLSKMHGGKLSLATEGDVV
ncbi:uncharacterized protein LOC128240123 isoform X2 [Mya arenaria]|uniref:uncharacterized protein LOC128240123 isoform X2 n=1 Tax=Mya arenaria TaxID=6604 RepID=UPI0022DF65E9|nr:uncharacterized protein LOC128240123 isoform X2 [Mya arenaria]